MHNCATATPRWYDHYFANRPQVVICPYGVAAAAAAVVVEAIAVSAAVAAPFASPVHSMILEPN